MERELAQKLAEIAEKQDRPRAYIIRKFLEKLVAGACQCSDNRPKTPNSKNADFPIG